VATFIIWSMNKTALSFPFINFVKSLEKDSSILIEERINEDNKNSKYLEVYCFFSTYEIFEIVIKLEAQQIIYKFSV
jgi:hypothetical protein